MSEKKDFKILIIDDDKKILKVLKHKLNMYNTVASADPKAGLKKLREEHFDLLVLDYLLVDITGDAVVNKIRKFNKTLYIFLLTGCDKTTLKPLESLKDMDIQFYCEKGSDVDNIIIAVESAVKSINFLKGQKETFSTRLKALRKSRGVGQEELAQYLGVGRTAIANWEIGITEPGSDKLKKVATFFQVTTDYLLCHEVDYSRRDEK